MEKKISIAKSMPLTFAIVSGVFAASYMFASLLAEFSIGRPSSTLSIGFFFAPIYSLIVAFIGYFVGLIPRFFLKRRAEKDMVKKSPYLIKIAIITIVLGALFAAIGVKQVIDYEEFNSPHLLSNTANFSKTKYSENEIPSVTKKAKLSWEYNNKNKGTLTWNQMNLATTVHNSTQLLISNDNKTLISYDLKGYTYITEVRLLPINNSENIGYLTVLVRLRATSHRSMLLIYDQDFNLVYEELLNRCRRFQDMGSTSAVDGELIVVNICKPFIINVN